MKTAKFVLGTLITCVAQSAKALQPLHRKKIVNSRPSSSSEISTHVSPPLHQLEKWAKTAVLCGMITIAQPVLMGVAVAAAVAPFDPQVYTNDYADPLHPFCERHVTVNADGRAFQYTGTGVGNNDVDVTALRGCSPAEKKAFGSRKSEFTGIITADGRFSAGDGVNEGVWEPKREGTAAANDYQDADGIRWNDGNKWVVKDQSVVVQRRQKDGNQQYQVTTKGPGFAFGETIVFAYVALSGLAGIKGVADTARRKREQENS